MRGTDSYVNMTAIIIPIPVERELDVFHSTYNKPVVYALCVGRAYAMPISVRFCLANSHANNRRFHYWSQFTEFSTNNHRFSSFYIAHYVDDTIDRCLSMLSARARCSGAVTSTRKSSADLVAVYEARRRIREPPFVAVPIVVLNN